MFESEDAVEPLEPDPQLLGRIVGGNFRLESPLGFGGMGTVYRATQLSLHKAVAVKVLHKHLMTDDKLVKRFRREARSASLLSHPNLIQTIDTGQDPDGLLYIAMELLEGRDLARVIREDFPMPLARVVSIMSQVFAALAEAHRHGIIHRDLKPSNIIVMERPGETEFAKVCDFGIAKAQTSRGGDEVSLLTLQGLVCGTPEYMAPEQARAEPLDGRADLYAAACILYQMITGDLPFKASSLVGMLAQHLTELPQAPSLRRPELNIPPELDALVLRGLEKGREDRPQTAMEFRRELEAIAPAGARATQAAVMGPPQNPTLAYASGPRPGQARVNPTPASPAVATPASPRVIRSGRVPAAAAAVGAALVLVVGGTLLPKWVRLHSQRDRPAALPQSTPVDVPAAKPAEAATLPIAPLRALPAEAVIAPAQAEVPRDRQTAAIAATPDPPAGRRVHPKAAARAARPRAETAAAVVAAPAPIPPAPVAEEPRRSPLAEADALLAQGNPEQACARAEEAKRTNAKSPAIYKFLGKCYMRAGRTAQANENYRRYLELDPAAPDALFIKSIVK